MEDIPLKLKGKVASPGTSAKTSDVERRSSSSRHGDTGFLETVEWFLEETAVCLEYGN
jgi:hypothetical protein